MNRLTLALAVALAALVAAIPAFASTPKLTGAVGPGFTITLEKGSTKVTKLKPGKYTIVVNDRSNIHDFHLSGPGVNKATSIPGKGTKTWKVTLKRGTYKYVCDPHTIAMHGSFKVR